MTTFVKGCVARGQASPPEAHVIKYARGGAIHCVEIYGRSFTCYFSKLGAIKKKVIQLKPLNIHLVCFDVRLER